ncbi:hypothetical protein BD408DRAFT_426254 [Parasitella parasitica]|nr:hypothetical protein BD408DRAFT_426254 [Parasitella parasitica]
MKNFQSTIESAMRDELTCAVCQDIFKKPQALIPCLHTFCLHCVNSIPSQYGNDTLTCPICREKINSFSSNFSIQNFIDIFNSASSDKIKEIASISDTTKPNAAVSESPTPVIDMNNDEEPQQDEAESSNTTFSIAAASSSASSYQSVSNFEMSKKPCRSCIYGNNTGYSCLMPITNIQQDGFGHLLCGYCLEFMPARGFGGNEPAFNQCCSFCGVVACDEYWKCKNKSKTAKLYILSEIADISNWIQDLDSIETKEGGYLNKAEIELLKRHLTQSDLNLENAWATCLNDFDENIYTAPIIRRMTPLGLQIYNTRRLPTYTQNLNVENDEEDTYYDRIQEEGILPSENLRACYSCVVTIVNGQFYGYWKNIIDRRSEYIERRDPCRRGSKCDAQWRTLSHAQRLCHIDVDF